MLTAVLGCPEVAQTRAPNAPDGHHTAASVTMAPTTEQHAPRRADDRREHLLLACNMGEPVSCGQLAHQLDRSGEPARAAAFRAVELSLQSCASGDAQACGTLGFAYLNGTAVGPDIGRATSLLEVACRQGQPRACHNLGVLYFEGRGLPRLPEHAVALFTGACEAGDANACAALGSALQQGVGASPDPTRALQLYQDSCRAGAANGCAGLAVAKLQGEGIERDVAGAVLLLRRACARGSAHGCRHLGELLERGRVVDRDPAGAVTAFTRACRGGNAGGCQQLSLLLARGAPRPAELQHHGILGAQDCRGADCQRARPAHSGRRDVELLLRQCAHGRADACGALGTHGGVTDPGF